LGKNAISRVSAKSESPVFEITPEGKFTTLYNFCSQQNCDDGTEPYAGPVQATNGNFHGPIRFGGTYGDGTIYSLAVGLGPFVETVPVSGNVGTAIIILGNNLIGATNVTFNGSAAKFKIVSSSEITATVPSGATTGNVEVKTPARTLISNMNFRVSSHFEAPY